MQAKKLLLSFSAMSIAPLGAAVLATDNFDDIPDGDLSADADWSAFSGADQSVDVTSGVVTGLGSGAEDIGISFAQTSGVFFSLGIVVLDDASSEYVMGFRDGSAQAARFFLAGDGTAISIGVNSGAGSSAGAVSTQTFALNTYVRIVGFADGNGTVSAWINPVLGDEATPDVTFTNSDIGGLDGFFLRQAGAWDNGSADWTADDLIIGTTFADVVPEPSSAFLGSLALLGLFRRKR